MPFDWETISPLVVQYGTSAVGALVMVMHASEMADGKVNQIELAAKLINRGKSLAEGIEYMHDRIDGSLSLLLLSNDGIYAARDRYGRSPLVVAERNGATIVVSETCAFKKLGFTKKGFTSLTA